MNSDGLQWTVTVPLSEGDASLSSQTLKFVVLEGPSPKADQACADTLQSSDAQPSPFEKCLEIQQEYFTELKRNF